MATPILEVEGVDLTYERSGIPLPLLRRDRKLVVSDMSFSVGTGETFALVGESGCGKTTIARAVAGLIVPIKGHISFEGQDITVAVGRRSRELLRRIQYVFQNPDASLNPRRSVAYAIGRSLDLFHSADVRDSRTRLDSLPFDRGGAHRFADTAPDKSAQIERLLSDVHLDASYMSRYPGQLSGGERQRVAIARALAADPELLICDEVISALDVSVQASILDLLRELQQTRGIAYLFIAHNLAVIRWLAHRVGVLYLGHLMETGTAEEVFSPPYQPYTEMLLSSVPEPDPDRLLPQASNAEPVHAPLGSRGCPFSPRCPRNLGAICDQQMPPWQQTSPTHALRCHISAHELQLTQ